MGLRSWLRRIKLTLVGRSVSCIAPVQATRIHAPPSRLLGNDENWISANDPLRTSTFTCRYKHLVSRSMSEKRTGRCICGEVSYAAVGQPTVVAQCHCEECRRLSGTGHSVGAMYPAEAVTVTGILRTFRYESKNGSEVTKASCASCGSPIFGSNTRLPGYLTLTLGTMDVDAGLQVEVVIFEADKRHWDQLGQDVTTFAGQPNWSPGK